VTIRGYLNYRLVKWLLAVGLLVTVPILAACDGETPAPTDIVTITPPLEDASLPTLPDANLEAAIREIINKPEGPIYASDLESLTTLDAREKDISDLTGLEYGVHLETLILGGNNISDISALAGLTNLDWLSLTNNKISDISALAGLTNLLKLNLWGNNISDISALSGLTNLIEIGLDNNSISDISALVANSGLSTGDFVYLGGCPLSNTSVDIYIPNLEIRGVNVLY